MFDFSPIDYYFLRESEFTMKFCFELPLLLDPRRLKYAILELLALEPLLSSGLVYKDEMHLAFQPLLNYDLDFTVELSDIDLPDEMIRKKFPIIQNLPEKNLLKFKLIQGPRRSLLLISMSHLLGDGHSFFLVSKAISSLYNGLSYRPFSHQRFELEQMATYLSHLEDLDLYKMVFDYSGYRVGGFATPSDRLYKEEIKFSKSGLAKLSQISKDQGHRLTDHVLLLALLAKEKGHRLNKDDDKILLRTPVDVRKRLDLGENFFGNAICDAHTAFDVEELKDTDVFTLAQRIKDDIQAVDFHYVLKQQSALKTLRLKKGISFLRNLKCPGTVFTNFTHMPLQDIIFEGGAPLRMIVGELYPNFVFIENKSSSHYSLHYQS